VYIKIIFPHDKNRKIEGDFSGGDLSIDGGLVLLGQVESQIGLMSKLSNCIRDPRNQFKVLHKQHETNLSK